MKFGIFSFWENYADDDRRAFADQLAMVRLADRLEFDEVWLAEHHFNPFSLCPSIFMLASHVAAVTNQIRIGTAAVLLPFQDPIRTAEDVATIDLLSGGRFNLGVARGAPVPVQEKHFRVPAHVSRPMTVERLDAISRLLAEDHVSIDGTSVLFSDVTIHPKPVQRPVPIFVATNDKDFVTHAAKRGYGLLGAQGWAVDRLKQTMACYQAADPISPCRLTVLRPFFVATSSKRAHQLADEGIEAFAARMKGYVQPPPEPGQPESGATLNQLRANAIVGDPIEVLEGIQALMAEVPMASLIFRPAAIDGAENQRSVKLFAEQVRPFLNGMGAAGEGLRS